MNISIHDIKSEVCQRCAACCRVQIPTDGDLRYKEWMEKIGYKMKVVGNSPNGHMRLMIDMGDCKYLDKKDGSFYCKIYEARPKMCKEFNCVAWALPSNSVDSSELCKQAHDIIKELKKEKETANESGPSKQA